MEQKVTNTANKVFVAIQENNVSDFKSLIGVSSLNVIGKDDEFLLSDVKLYNKLFKQYEVTDKNRKITISGLFNDLGQMVVRVPIFQGKIDSAGIKEMHLNILFGPPDIIPLSKISGYELIKNNSDSTSFIKR